MRPFKGKLALDEGSTEHDVSGAITIETTTYPDGTADWYGEGEIDAVPRELWLVSDRRVVLKIAGVFNDKWISIWLGNFRSEPGNPNPNARAEFNSKRQYF